MAEYILEMRDITKAYGSNKVLDMVTLKIRPGEIHALLGENGAGKSTLMNTLFGMPVIHEAGGFKGEIFLDGQPVKIMSPNDAMNLGIGMVHQEFMLIPGFTITENIKLNREKSKPTFISRLFGKNLEYLDAKAMATDAREALDQVGMSIEEYTYVKGLPVGYMQFIEIAREIDKKGVKLLVFDEPTAVLTESEAQQLMDVMRKISDNGIAIIFITHRLDEVMAITDNVTILRDGKLAATRKTAETNLVELAELMIGRGNENAVQLADKRELSKDSPSALDMKELVVAMPGERVRGTNLNVRQGEILGIGGLAGQGKIGIPNGIMGLYPAGGEVTFMDTPLPLNDAKGTLEKRLAFVSEDRRGVGLLLDESIEENIVFNALEINGDFKKPILPNPSKFRKCFVKCAALVAATALLLVGGFYGNSQWPDKNAPVSVPATQEEVAEDSTDDAVSAEGEVAEMEIEDGVVIDASTPIIARISPLFLILGFIGVFALIYVAAYPLIGTFTDKMQIKDTKAIRAYANKMIKDLDIRCRNAQQPVGTLSGGNQQKVCIAKALALKPKFLFASEPTRGIDIGAKELVLSTLVKLNREMGMTVVVVSSELMELKSVSDRIAIITEGKCAGIFDANAPDAVIGLAMSGISHEDHKEAI